MDSKEIQKIDCCRRAGGQSGACCGNKKSRGTPHRTHPGDGTSHQHRHGVGIKLQPARPAHLRHALAAAAGWQWLPPALRWCMGSTAGWWGRGGPAEQRA
eukprot:967237-Pelagomonas_calceolata.AAC.3